MRHPSWKRLFSIAFSLCIVSPILLSVGCSLREQAMDGPLIDESSSRARYVPSPVDEISAPSSELEAAYFEYDSVELTLHAKDVLRDNARWLKAHPDAAIEIEGYCDRRGTREYNLPLGQRRAEVAKRFLIQEGIAPVRIDTVSHGKVEDDNPSSWARNRRAGFTIFYSSAINSSATR